MLKNILWYLLFYSFLNSGVCRASNHVVCRVEWLSAIVATYITMMSIISSIATHPKSSHLGVCEAGTTENLSVVEGSASVSAK